MKLKRMTAILAAGLTASALMAAPAAASEAAAAADETISALQNVDSAAEDALTEAEAAAAETESALAGAESVAEAPEELPRPEYRALDFVTLGEYKGLSVEVDPIEIEDSDVDYRIEQTIHSSEAGSDVLTEGTVENGDVANIDFEGKKDGVAFEGGASTGYDLEIGSGTFIPGFEEGLVGVSVGETVDLDVTFPEQYGNADLAGQPVVFTVTVNSLKRFKELDDELASALSDGNAKTVDEYKEQVKGMLEEEALNARTNNAKTELLQMAADNTTVNEFPQDLLDYSVNEVKQYFESYASMYGVDLATFLNGMFGMSEEEFPARAEELAKENIRGEFAIGAIAETEGLLPEGDELSAAYDELAAQYGYESGEALIAMAGEYSVKYALEQERVRDFLFENANVTERVPEADSQVESAAAAVIEEMADVESDAS